MKERIICFALGLSADDIVGHLGMEHEYMKTRDPKDDPDRKRK